jgi:hypothetical protein
MRLPQNLDTDLLAFRKFYGWVRVRDPWLNIELVELISLPIKFADEPDKLSPNQFRKF